MKASDAVTKIGGCTELEVELHKLSVAICSNSDLQTSLSEKCGVYNIAARLDYAATLILEYHTVLNAALANTELEGM